MKEYFRWVKRRITISQIGSCPSCLVSCAYHQYSYKSLICFLQVVPSVILSVHYQLCNWLSNLFCDQFAYLVYTCLCHRLANLLAIACAVSKPAGLLSIVPSFVLPVYIQLCDQQSDLFTKGSTISCPTQAQLFVPSVSNLSNGLCHLLSNLFTTGCAISLSYLLTISCCTT